MQLAHRKNANKVLLCVSPKHLAPTRSSNLHTDSFDLPTGWSSSTFPCLLCLFSIHSAHKGRYKGIFCTAATNMTAYDAGAQSHSLWCSKSSSLHATHDLSARPFLSLFVRFCVTICYAFMADEIQPNISLLLDLNGLAFFFNGTQISIQFISYGVGGFLWPLVGCFLLVYGQIA